MTTFACGQCGAGLAFEGGRTARCPYCDSPNFVERPAAVGQPEPRFAVTFVGDAQLARRNLDRWLGSRHLLADSRLRHASVEELRGIYVPCYLYSAIATTRYAAEIGEQYTEVRTYTTYSGKRPVVRTRVVVKTEYRELSGVHVDYVSDVVVSASAGLSNAELERIEPFDLKQMRRFSPAMISGWIAEDYARAAGDCERSCRDEVDAMIGKALRAFLPGDSHRGLTWSTEVSRESMDPLLVPVWVFAVRYRKDREALRVVINGQTGTIAGKVPLSTWKVALLVLIVGAVVAAILLHGGTP